MMTKNIEIRNILLLRRLSCVSYRRWRVAQQYFSGLRADRETPRIHSFGRKTQAPIGNQFYSL